MTWLRFADVADGGRWAEQEVQSWSGVTPHTGTAVPGDAFSPGW